MKTHVTTLHNGQPTHYAKTSPGSKRVQAAPPGAQEDARMRAACADFEAMLLNFLVEGLRKTLPGDSVFGSSHQKSMYEAMFFQEVTTKLAHDKGLGLGEALYRQLQKQGDSEISEGSVSGPVSVKNPKSR